MTTPEIPPAIPGMTTDMDPDNPVSQYPADVFPYGAALTVAYGSNERPFCTLGNLYRVLGHLTLEVPMADDVNAAIIRCRAHVQQQLPSELRVVDPPPDASADNSVADQAWVAHIVNRYGPTIRLTPLPGATLPTPTDT